MRAGTRMLGVTRGRQGGAWSGEIEIDRGDSVSSIGRERRPLPKTDVEIARQANVKLVDPSPSRETRGADLARGLAMARNAILPRPSRISRRFQMDPSCARGAKTGARRPCRHDPDVVDDPSTSVRDAGPRCSRLRERIAARAAASRQG